MNRTTLIPALLAVALALPTAAAPRPAKEPQKPAPPQPVPQQVKATRGQDMEIALRVYGRPAQGLRFLIRQMPRTGRLTLPGHSGADAARVLYHPPEDRSITRESFQYAVRTDEGVSAPATVEIEIADVPAELFAPAEIAFARRITGTSEVRTLELENRGGTISEGDIGIDAPWAVEGAARYRIEPGARAIVQVRFAPGKAGDFRGEVRFSSQPGRITSLRGVAVEPIAIQPARIQLAAELTTLVRAGVCEVTNHTDEPLRVRIVAPARIKTEPELLLQPGETRPLVIRTEPGDAVALSGELRFEAGAHRAQTTIEAEPLPAMLRISSDRLELRREKGAAASAAEIIVENTGGTPTEVKASAGPGLRVEPESAALAGGATARFAISAAGDAPGDFESHIELRSSTGTRSIPVHTIATSAPPRLAPSPAAAARKTVAAPIAEPSRDPLALSRTMDRPTSITPRSCTIEWAATLSSASTFAAEVRDLTLVDKALTITWRDIPSLRIERTEASVRCIIDDLDPGQRYTVRIVPIEPDGKRGTPLVQAFFLTPPEDTAGARRGWAA